MVFCTEVCHIVKSVTFILFFFLISGLIIVIKKHPHPQIAYIFSKCSPALIIAIFYFEVFKIYLFVIEG